MVKYIGKIVLGEDMYHIKDIEARTNLIDKSEKGAASGVATLDASGKVPSTQLPSYVDDVIEAYYYGTEDPDTHEITYAMYSDSQHTTLITPETGKIYVDLSSNESYRWSGSTYVVISSPYTLPQASSSVLGGIKVGTNLSIDGNGVLSADAGTEVEIGSGSPVDTDVKLFVDESAPVIEIITGGFKLTTNETTGTDSFSAIGTATISNNATTGIDVFTFSAD